MLTLIKNGTVFRPLTGQLNKEDVWIRDGRICERPDSSEDYETIAAEDCYVLPGLIDSHVHIDRLGDGFGTNADLLCLPNGVVWAIDAGSLGTGDIGRLADVQIPLYDTKSLVLLNVAKEGQRLDRIEDLSSIDRDAVIACFEKYPKLIAGLKIRYEEAISGSLGMEPLLKTIELSEELKARGINCPVTVHLGETGKGLRLESILGALRKGDVAAHILRGKDETIFDEAGRIKECVLSARERGVRFDFAHGRTNFTFENIKRARDNDFWPDLLGTDIHGGNVWRKSAFSMMCTLTMMYALGMPLKDIFKAVTYNPAEIYGFSDRINRFEYGDIADVAVLYKRSTPVELKDITGDIITASESFMTRTVIKDGKVIYSEL